MNGLCCSPEIIDTFEHSQLISFPLISDMKDGIIFLFELFCSDSHVVFDLAV